MLFVIHNVSYFHVEVMFIAFQPARLCQYIFPYFMNGFCVCTSDYIGSLNNLVII